METTLENSLLSVRIKHKGAELCSLKTAAGTELLWQADKQHWARHSPVLFPIIGAVPGGIYRHAGQEYKMGNHGFAREQDFSVRAATTTMVHLELRASEATRTIYPFDFVLGLIYCLEGSTLRLEYRVDNPGREVLPFSIGAHPGFNVPFVPGESKTDCRLRFQRPETLSRHILTKDNVRSGQTLPFLDHADTLEFTDALFAEGAIVLSGQSSETLSLESLPSGRRISVSFPGFPSLGIWAPGPTAPFVCIEPWHGIMCPADFTGEFQDIPGMTRLAPGTGFSAALTITVS